MTSTGIALVLTTVSTEAEAAALVKALLDRRLVACGTILPQGRSLYRWEGKLADEPESVILLKTSAARVSELRAAFEALHPYKVPELLVFPVSDGLERYLSWIADETATVAP